MCTALLARRGAQVSTPCSLGRGRLQPGRHLLETLPAWRAGRERGAGTVRACLSMGPPHFQQLGQGAAPLPGTPSRGLLFKPLPPSLGASNAGMPLAIHSPEQGGRAEETPLPCYGRQELSSKQQDSSPAFLSLPHTQSRGQCHSFTLGAGSCPPAAELLAPSRSCSSLPRAPRALRVEDGLLWLPPGADREPGLCPPAWWCPAASISERL